jgi:regulator of sirC expression with transglutaminase-like and TPR domain
MPDPTQLQHLIKLLDDDSDIVRETVLKELAAYGPSLETELIRQHIQPSENEKQIMQDILEGHNRTWLKEQWSSWKTIREDKQRLEAALSLLSAFQTGTRNRKKLPSLLDELAQEFKSGSLVKDARGLADFLFDVKGIQGAISSEYYDPQNSDLVFVVEQKRGIPISLASIYILEGARLGIKIEGCNFPGHFLTTANYNRKKVIVDCFDGGRFISDKEIAFLNDSLPVTAKELKRLECNADTIIMRALRNLINAYHKSDELENERLMIELLEKTLP